MALKIRVCSSVSPLETENSFNKSLTIASLKSKLELITGAQANKVELSVFNEDNKLVCKLDDDGRTLGEYNLDNNLRLHVLDTSGTKIENVETVKKLELTDEEYAKRKDSVRAFKQRMKFGDYAEESEEEKAKKREKEEERERLEKEKLASMKLGDRCEVSVLGQPRRRGVIKHIGKTDFKAGNWVGVAYDEPLGKHNGSVSGKSYFTCANKHGAFVKGECVEVGDFPEIGPDDDEM